MVRALILLFLLAQTAGAEVRVQRDGVDLLRFGGFCPPRASRPVAAPNTAKGRILVVDAPFAVTSPGDVLRAAPDLGFGIVLRLNPTFGGLPLTGQFWREGRPETMESWPLRPLQDGSLAIGLAPDPGRVIAPGRYRLAVYDAQRSLFVIAFAILATDARAAVACPDLIS